SHLPTLWEGRLHLPACRGGRCEAPGGGVRLPSARDGCAAPPPLLQLLAHPRHEPAHPQQVVHELWKSLGAILVALAHVADHALLEVDLELVAFLYRLGGLRRLQDRVAHVDRVTKEDACKGVGDDERDAGASDGDGRDLSRGAASEARAADQAVPLRDLRGPRVPGRHSFHGVLAELFLVQRLNRVLGRDDLVGVDVVAEFPRTSADDLVERQRISAGIFSSTSLGCEITPVTALAAATAGLERYTCASGGPMRSRPWRFAVVPHTSPSPST